MLSRHLWQLKTIVFLHWCLIRSVLFLKTATFSERDSNGARRQGGRRLPGHRDAVETADRLCRPGVNVIKLFFFVTDDEAQQARAFALGNPFQLGLRI